MNFRGKFLLFFVIFFIAALPLRAADGYLTILMYHRFDAGGSISVPFADFKEQITYLQDNGYKFLSLRRVKEKLEKGESFEEKSVLLTIDDGYKSTYTHAYPYLKKKKIPWVLYVYTDAIDEGYGSFLSWDQIKEMVESGVPVENHTASHVSFITVDDKNDTWVEKEILAPERRIHEMTGRKPTSFALPYGTYDRETFEILRKKTDYSFIMGTDPGVVDGREKLYILSRMGLGGKTELSRFKNKVSRQHLSIKKVDVLPGTRLNSTPEEINVQLTEPSRVVGGPINVFISELGAQKWEWTDKREGKIKIKVGGRLTRPWNRLIITAFDRTEGKYRYYSQGLVFEN